MADEVAIDGSIAGGAISATGTRCMVGDKPVAVVGDEVLGHGDSPHDSVTMSEGSSRLVIGPDEVKVCFAGNLASCGDEVDSGTSPRITVVT